MRPFAGSDPAEEREMTRGAESRRRVRSVELAACAAVVLAAAGCGEEPPPPPPPLEIAVAAVIQRDQPITLEMVGETRGSSDVPVRTRVAGFLEGIHFVEGRPVEKGQLLYSLDRQPFEAKVAEVEGVVAEARTMVAKTKADLDRIRPLAEMHAVSQQDLDSAVAQYQAALGSLQAARAQLEQANIELGYTNVLSPIGGRIGISKVREGEYVGEGSAKILNYVSRTDPIRVRFAIDERSYLRLARRIRDDERRDDGPALELILADGTLHPGRGRVVATEAAVDPQTGTFTLEADFPNPDDLVLAGQFARVRGVVEVREGALLVPDRALSELQGGFRAFVVDADGKVELRPVELGPKIERLRIVEKGLSAGERVALDGLQKLEPGMTVKPVPTRLDDAGNPVEAPAASPGPPGA